MSTILWPSLAPSEPSHIIKSKIVVFLGTKYFVPSSYWKTSPFLSQLFTNQLKVRGPWRPFPLDTHGPVTPPYVPYGWKTPKKASWTFIKVFVGSSFSPVLLWSYKPTLPAAWLRNTCKVVQTLTTTLIGSYGPLTPPCIQHGGRIPVRSFKPLQLPL